MFLRVDVEVPPRVTLIIICLFVPGFQDTNHGGGVVGLFCRPPPGGFKVVDLKGYLAHTKPPPPLGPP